MKLDQRYTPKYWIFHNRLTDDVFIETGCKSLYDCKSLADKLHTDLYNDYCNNDNSCYTISLFELNLLEIIK